jgi:Kef-type K+ transport system membrane component KefB
MDILIADVIGDVALVLVVCSLLGAVARRCGQPAVVGQILAGVLLGPSVLGRLPGHLTGRLFPHASHASCCRTSCRWPWRSRWAARG